MGKIFNKAALTERRKELRNNMPEPEHRLWTQLRGRQLKGYKFRRQASVEGYIVDFYCPELKLAIEVDGESHFDGSSSVYDQNRQRFIESYKVSFLRFTNRDIIESLDGVIVEILKVLPDKKTEL